MSAFAPHWVRTDQTAPDIAYNANNGTYLVVWHDYRAGEADPNIFGQIISAAGGLVGDNITITAQTYRQLYPQVAYGSGVYFVAWQDYPGTADAPYHVHGTVVSPTGEIAVADVTVFSGNDTHKGQPTDVVYNSTAGEFLVLAERRWTAKNQIWGRHVQPDGTTGAAIEIIVSASVHNTDAAGAYNADNDQYLIWMITLSDKLG